MMGSYGLTVIPIFFVIPSVSYPLQFPKLSEKQVALACGTNVDHFRFHHNISMQAASFYSVKEPISIRLPSGSAI